MPEAELKRSAATLAMSKLGVQQAQREATAALGALASGLGRRAGRHPGSGRGTGRIASARSFGGTSPTIGGCARAEVDAGGRGGHGRSGGPWKKLPLFTDLAVGLGAVALGEFAETGLVVSVEWPLPLFDQNKGRIDEARAKKRQAQQNVEAWKSDWLGALLEAHSRYGQYFERQETPFGPGHSGPWRPPWKRWRRVFKMDN